ncbi:MAG: CDP-alcohol phosphatidyltransferase family protein [Chloroflexi bacterium]|nr:CDP-alcohol phosphatidyltransferase family protein [Chloroflexota bacterium]
MYREKLEGLRRFFDPLARLLGKTGLTPDSLTVLGFLLSLGGAYVIATGHFLWGGVIVLVSGVFDILDGALARVTDHATPFGALLDSTLDRLSEAAVLFGLLIYYVNYESAWGGFLVYLTLVGSLMVSYVRARAEGLGLAGKEGIMTRAERVIILALGLLLNQVVPALLIVAVLAYATVLHRVIYVWQQTKKNS